VKMSFPEKLQAVIAARGYLTSAHRGAPSFAPDNSDLSVLAALEHQPDLIELDVRPTKDGHLILWHDSHVSAQGRRLTLRQQTLAQLQALELEQGARLWTLEQAFEATKNKSSILLDLKAPQLEQPILSAIRRCNAKDLVVCGSYTSTLRAMQASGVAASYTPDPLRDLWKQRLVTGLKWDALTVHHRTVTTDLLQRANAAGVRVIAWTVDDPKRMQQLIEMGIHGITTNKIEILTQLQKETYANAV
jgi:glycerophosphoryl diester phosphodiesterase